MQPIPFIDLSDASLITLTEQHAQRGRDLLAASRNAFGLASRVISPLALPLGDAIAKRWLERTRNPYLEEIQNCATLLGTPGVYALNLAYEWGCTSGAYDTPEGVRLARVLDWPFPALGETMVVAHQQAAAGEFINVTWPGVSGIFNAMAPGRFACALNQAPMRRWRGNILTDWTRNRLRAYHQHALPPAHLLRHAFETARDYEAAKRMLCTEPVALPVIYALSGVKPGEGCVIERLEDAYAVRELHAGSACAANHFESHLNGIGYGWMPRAIDSHARAKYGAALSHHLLDMEFNWFTTPIANPLSRLALLMDAGKGSVSLTGTQGATPVTQAFHYP